MDLPLTGVFPTLRANGKALDTYLKGFLGRDSVLEQRRLVANYEAGDVVPHSPFMVHAATPKRPSKVRVAPPALALLSRPWEKAPPVPPPWECR